MSRRVLDTDILSEIIKGKNTSVAARAVAYLAEQGRFTTSAVTVAEIVYGFRRMGREDRVAQFEASLDALRSDVPIVTGNVAHFEQVRAIGYELTIENWRTG